MMLGNAYLSLKLELDRTTSPTIVKFAVPFAIIANIVGTYILFVIAILSRT